MSAGASDASSASGSDELVVASEVQPGDVLRSRDGTEFTVSRVEPFTTFGVPLIAFIEDTDVRWFKMPSATDAEVTRVRRA